MWKMLLWKTKKDIFGRAHRDKMFLTLVKWKGQKNCESGCQSWLTCLRGVIIKIIFEFYSKRNTWYNKLLVSYSVCK